MRWTMLQRIPSVLAYGIFGFLCLLMLEISLQYRGLHPDVAFLRIKQDEIQLGYYLPAFLTHAWSAPFVLIAGFTQFSRTLRARQPRIHRASGWFYAVVVLTLTAPSGLILAFHANGGWTSKLGFTLLALLWWGSTWIALKKAIRARFHEHRAWMIRSFAFTLSAISLRAWKWIIVATLHPRPMDTYRVVAWLSWVGNWIVAEIIIYHLQRRRR
jgi:hypothetical protein